MKTLTINEREHELSFGIAFIRELDKKFCSNVNGMNFGAGVVLRLCISWMETL